MGLDLCLVDFMYLFTPVPLIVLSFACIERPSYPIGGLCDV